MDKSNDLKNLVGKMGDAISEATHRVKAAVEKTDRDVAGDTMTPTEKLGSVVTEGKERLLAGVDHAKRELRDKT
jgi:hypothetical protein